jgi:hypothetical protein
MHAELGSFNVYNIYDQCPSSRGEARPDGTQTHPAGGGYSLAELQDARHGEGSKEHSQQGVKQSLHPHPGLNAGLNGALNDWLCGGEEAMGRYLGIPEVMQVRTIDGTEVRAGRTLSKHNKPWQWRILPSVAR